MRMDVDTLDQDDLRREGGEEMEGMTLMVPRFSRKGKLYAGESASPLSPYNLSFLAVQSFFRPHLYPAFLIISYFPEAVVHRHRGATDKQPQNNSPDT
jgi:hypothetical protein